MEVAFLAALSNTLAATMSRKHSSASPEMIAYRYPSIAAAPASQILTI